MKLSKSCEMSYETPLVIEFFSLCNELFPLWQPNSLHQSKHGLDIWLRRNNHSFGVLVSIIIFMIRKNTRITPYTLKNNGVLIQSNPPYVFRFTRNIFRKLSLVLLTQTLVRCIQMYNRLGNNTIIPSVHRWVSQPEPKNNSNLSLQLELHIWGIQHLIVQLIRVALGSKSLFPINIPQKFSILSWWSQSGNISDVFISWIHKLPIQNSHWWAQTSKVSNRGSPRYHTLTMMMATNPITIRKSIAIIHLSVAI